MRKNEKGILSIEASIVLCALTLLMLFLFNFATVYRAENMVSHATIQTADAVALESYLRETSFENDAQNVLFWANRINGVENITADSFESLRTANLPTIAREKFALAIGENTTEANAILLNLCVKDGLSGVDLSQSYVDLNNNDVIIKADYTVRLRFPVFGAKELRITKAAKAKTAGEILFGLNVIPEQQIMGSTKGSGQYNMGTQVQISAESNYGYDFVCWDDGNTENPRTVTVAGAQTYVAKFQRHNFGVNLFISDASVAGGRVRGSNAFGKVSAVSGGNVAVGGSEYSYEGTVTVRVETNPGYTFMHWRGSKVSDTGVESIYRTESSFDIRIDGIYDLTAAYQPNSYDIAVRTDCDAAKNSIGVREKGTSQYATSVSVKYGKQFQLKAGTLAGYTFLGWYKGGERISDKTEVELAVPVGGGTYEARYDKNPVITVVANGQGTVKILQNGKTSYDCKRGSVVEIQAVPKSGYYFAGWSDGKDAQHWVTVNSDMTLTATFKRLYSVTVTAGAGGTATGGGTSFKDGATATLKATPNAGYQFVKWEKSTNGTSYTEVSRKAEYSVTVTSNVYYRAIFSRITYTVTLNANSGYVATKRSDSYTVNHGDSSRTLPKPVRQGYRFAGWKYGNNTYNNGSVVTNITSNITLVAQWTQCKSHVWGRCGVTHTTKYPTKLSAHSSSHKTGSFQCSLCVECGKFDSGSCKCGKYARHFASDLNYENLGAVHLCYDWRCDDYWNGIIPKVYNIHDQIGYP